MASSRTPPPCANVSARSDHHPNRNPPRGRQKLYPSTPDEEASCAAIDVNDVPQAFSHFSYECSKGKQLVCDLQGVWNPDDGFVLTDPVVHYVSSRGKRHKNGATDKGLEGVKRFFNTHKCNALCAKMKLPARTADTLIVVAK